MIRDLTFQRRPSASGETRSLVVFVHGYGANGADLIGLAEPLAPHLPDTLFLSPDAPDRVPGAPFGLQWFPIPWLDGSSAEAAERGLLAAARDLDAFLDVRLAEAGLPPSSLALVGFSQGSMISLHVAARRSEPVACVVAFSGRLLAPERLAAETRSRPPVLLAHGDMDDVVPFADMGLAGRALDAAGFDVSGHVMRGTAHGIAPDGLGAAAAFLAGHLPA